MKKGEIRTCVSTLRRYTGMIDVEIALLAILLCGRLFLFLQTKGTFAGHDVQVHLAMLDRWPWDPAAWNVRSSFYAYHPPIAFLLAKIVTLAGAGKVVAVQWVSALASLIAFFSLRSFLQSLKLLKTRRGIAFLTLSSSLPLIIHLTHSINIDMLIYAFTCMIFAATARIIRGEITSRKLDLITFLLAFALYTKYSALLLLPLPLLMLLFLSRLPLKKSLTIGSVIPLVALTLALPYYTLRYVAQEGTFLPSNMDFVEYSPDTQWERETIRDSNRTAFLWDLFYGTSPGTEGIHQRDQKRLRLLNTWKDFWAGLNVSQSHFSLLLSKFYAALAFPMILIGLARVFRKSGRGGAHVWHRLVAMLSVFAIPQIVLLAVYAYHYPHPIGLMTKGSYIVPVVLTVSALMVNAFPPLRTFRTLPWHCAFSVALGAFALLNHALPVY